jgi:hypothetical protein
MAVPGDRFVMSGARWPDISEGNQMIGVAADGPSKSRLGRLQGPLRNYLGNNSMRVVGAAKPHSFC